jgi:hypothetical protein
MIISERMLGAVGVLELQHLDQVIVVVRGFLKSLQALDLEDLVLWGQVVVVVCMVVEVPAVVALQVAGLPSSVNCFVLLVSPQSSGEMLDSTHLENLRLICIPSMTLLAQVILGAVQLFVLALIAAVVGMEA